MEKDFDMKLIKLWIFLLGIFLTKQGIAQSSYQHSYHLYSFDLIKSEGLFKGLIKDERGLVWIASDEGITIFDGIKTEILKHPLVNGYIKDFLIRKNGDFLVLFDTGIAKIIRLPGGAWQVESYIDTKLDYPKSLYEDATGKLFIGENNKITELNKGSIKHHTLPEEINIPSLWRTFLFDEDAFGNLWATSYNGNLYAYNRNKETFFKVPLTFDVGGINSMVCLGQDKILLGATNGFYELTLNKAQQLVSMQAMPFALNDISVIKKKGNDLLIGTWNQGLFKMQLKNGKYTLERISVLTHPDIIDIHISEDGIWLAGNENIGFVEEVPFGVSPIRNQTNLIQSLSLTPNNELLLSEGLEVFLLDEKENKASDTKYRWSTGNIYVKKAIFSGDSIWVGDFDGMVFIHNVKSKTTQQLNIPQGSGLGIEDMLKDSRGDIWATGNTEVGIVRFSGGKEDFYLGHPALVQCVVLKENEQGQVMAAGNTNGLVFYFNTESNAFDSLQLTTKLGKPLRDLLINDICFYKGNVYLATDKGVKYFQQTANTEAKVVANQLPLEHYTSIETKAIVADSENNFWIANNFGLIKRNAQGEISFFDRSQGLPSKVIKERGLLLDISQTLWIATEKGLSFIKHPALLSKQANKSYLQSVSTNSREVDFVKDAERQYQLDNLYYGDNIVLQFFSDLYPKQSIEYQYTLNNGDTTLQTISKQADFSLLNAQSGEYELTVRVKKDTGYTWSDEVKVVFTVRPYLYQQSWVLAVLMLVLCIGLFYLVRWYKKRVKIQAKKLEEIVKERTQELNTQKNELIDQQQKIIEQKDELLAKNESLFETKNALTHAELKFRESKEKQLEDELAYRNKQLTSHTLNILQKSELMEELAKRIAKLINKPNGEPYSELKKIKKYIDNSLHLEKDWDDFKLYFEQVHTSFYSKLAISHPNLTSNELRHCALIRLNLSLTECASILGISTESVKIARFRLRKKLELHNNQSLTEFIMGI